MTFDAISIRSRSEYGRSGKPPATKDFERIARMVFGALVLIDVLNEVCACDV